MQKSSHAGAWNSSAVSLPSTTGRSRFPVVHLDSDNHGKQTYFRHENGNRQSMKLNTSTDICFYFQKWRHFSRWLHLAQLPRKSDMRSHARLFPQVTFAHKDAFPVSLLPSSLLGVRVKLKYCKHSSNWDSSTANYSHSCYIQEIMLIGKCWWIADICVYFKRSYKIGPQLQAHNINILIGKVCKDEHQKRFLLYECPPSRVDVHLNEGIVCKIIVKNSASLKLLLLLGQKFLSTWKTFPIVRYSASSLKEKVVLRDPLHVTHLSFQTVSSKIRLLIRENRISTSLINFNGTKKPENRKPITSREQ